ncbi:hypothetical protein G7Y89_g15753 [Cudoniella acicularis]|uniref:Uncharacterized protein n=1 Tax=Cudoniella acicularis TaxID=354080 RepID=A0A8H4QG12_9HELO|nr:hypothetical protein G7Y89_g15753 [Cudoniella acicularis]
MNSREDHVLSWDSYGASNLSGIGPSNSDASSRSRRQREIEQGYADGETPVEGKIDDGSIEREIQRWSENGAREAEFGDMGLAGPPTGAAMGWMNDECPETPLSAGYGRESWIERESWCRR